jgi:hypothetical protein
VIDLNQFFDQARTVMNRRLSQAWDEGAAECDVLPDEFTVEEQIALGNAIRDELAQLPGFALRIDQNSKANDGKLGPLLERVDDLWVNRYNDFSNQAKVLSCKDEKLLWVLGPTEKHCRTCPRLNGKVKRGSTWEASGIRPQNPPNNSLECGGWNCLCELKPTDRAISKGPLPR